MLIGGTALVGLTLWGFVFLIGKPKYTTLYSGLRAADAQAMGTRPAAKNIPYELSPDGTAILVPVDKVDSSRLETAAQGLPRNARLGFELFDTPNCTLEEARRKREATDSLRERQLQNFREEERRQDQRELDDMFVIRRGPLRSR